MLKLEEAYKVMGLASAYMKDVSKIFDEMSGVKINDDQLIAYVEELFIDKDYVEKNQKVSTRAINLVNDIYKFATTHPTQLTSTTKGTLYGAYNAVSGYFTHVKDYKSSQQRMNSICFGVAHNYTKGAFNLAVKATTNKKLLKKKLLTV